MEAQGSLLHSQEPATSPYPEPDQSSSCPPSHFFKMNVNVILPSAPTSPSPHAGLCVTNCYLFYNLSKILDYMFSQ
jgi:hypothetical protein